MKILSLLALALALSCPAWAKTEKIRETALPNGLKVHEYRLGNGLQILLVPDTSAPVVTFQAWFKVGSADEKMDPALQRTGLAHLFEHMMFRGTPKNPDQVFDNKLSAAGAVGMNATTWFDRTNYFESVPKERLELVLELESDRMANLVINEQLFKTELGAVFGELKMRNDKPGSVAYEKVWNLAFDQHPYKYSVIGTPEELNSFTVKDAMHFYRTFYAPNNATIILLGDFKVTAALRLVEKYYAKMKPQPLPARNAPLEPPQTKARAQSLSHPLAVSDVIMLGYKIPAMNHPDMAALEVAASVLAYGNGSWLEQELVQEGIVSSVSASPSKARYPSLFLFSLQMAQGKSSEAALRTIRAAISRLAEGEVSPAELERAKNQFLLYSYGELSSQSNIGKNLGDALVATDNYLREFEILEEVKKVTVADLQRVAKAHLIENHSNLLTVSPAKGN